MNQMNPSSWQIPQWSPSTASQPALQRPQWQQLRGDNAAPAQAAPDGHSKAALQNAYQDSMTQYVAGSPMKGTGVVGGNKPPPAGPTDTSKHTQVAGMLQGMGMSQSLSDALGGPRDWKEGALWATSPAWTGSNVGQALGQTVGGKAGDALSWISKYASPQAGWEALKGLF